MWQGFKWQALGTQQWTKVHRVPSLTESGVDQRGPALMTGSHKKGKGSPATGRRPTGTTGASGSRVDARRESERLPWRGSTWAETGKVTRQGVEADPGRWPMSGEKGNPRFLKLLMSCCIYQWWLLSTLWTSCFVRLCIFFLFKLIWVGVSCHQKQNRRHWAHHPTRQRAGLTTLWGS